MNLRPLLLVVICGALLGAAVAGSAFSKPAPLPRPKFGRSFDVGLISGVVIVRPAKGTPFQLGTKDRSIVSGSELDTRRGVVDLRAAMAHKSTTVQDGHFKGGLFRIVQRPFQKGLTVLKLAVTGNSRRQCSVATSSLAARKRLSNRVLSLLRANVHGTFRTRGRYSAGTVRGTSWETVERCDGTLTRVYRGTVAVRDYHRRKTILVHAGHSYLARAR
jgi:hypothetical protein